MKDFKNYSQQYERFYGDEKHNFDLDKITLYKNSPGSLDEYIELLNENSIEMERVTFKLLVKMWWLLMRFCYNGRHRDKMSINGPSIDRAFAYFMRRHAGIETKVFFGGKSPLPDLATYMNDFFPNFNEGNPFIENYEYPFKYMTFGCLLLVRKMDERMDLLNYGEKKKMKYGDFIDYVINYTACYNEEHGAKYVFGERRNCNAPFNIKKIKI